jgi:hypothetical protein
MLDNGAARTPFLKFGDRVAMAGALCGRARRAVRPHRAQSGGGGATIASSSIFKNGAQVADNSSRGEDVRRGCVPF